jgi:hypothetical protein
MLMENRPVSGKLDISCCLHKTPATDNKGLGRHKSGGKRVGEKKMLNMKVDPTMCMKTQGTGQNVYRISCTFSGANGTTAGDPWTPRAGGWMRKNPQKFTSSLYMCEPGAAAGVKPEARFSTERHEFLHIPRQRRSMAGGLVASISDRRRRSETAATTERADIYGPLNICATAVIPMGGHAVRRKRKRMSSPNHCT